MNEAHGRPRLELHRRRRRLWIGLVTDGRRLRLDYYLSDVEHGSQVIDRWIDDSESGGVSQERRYL